MPNEERDLAYLEDMLSAAQEAVDFCADLTQEGFVQDRKTSRAVERSLEVLGEAARRVSKEFQQTHPSLPWKKIIGQRNVLAHDYGEIMLERVFLVVRRHLPELITTISEILKIEGND